MTAFPKPARRKPRRRHHINEHEQRYRDWVANRGCLVCGKPASLHHVRGARSTKSYTLLPRRKAVASTCIIPLCRWHHQDAPDSIHNLDEEAFGVQHLGGSTGVLEWAMTLLATYISQGEAR